MLALAAPAALSAIGVWLTHGYYQRDVLVGNDVRELWLPTWTYLGQSLSNGHVPLWDPHVLSGRPFAAVSGFDRLPPGEIAGFEHEAAEEFFRAVASSARLTLHIELQAGTNAHHMIEACFKAFARALRAAVAIDPEETGVPSTKGVL